MANKELSSEWTFLWDLSVFVLSIGGIAPQLATLCLGLILVLTFTFFCQNTLPSNFAKVFSTVIANSPIVASFGLTLWHDVPMTAGLFLFCGLLARSERIGKREVALFIAAFLLINTRFNGPWTVFLTLFSLLFLRQLTLLKFAILLALLVFVSLPLSFANAAMARFENGQSSGITHWMKYDVSCFISKHSGIKSQPELNQIFEEEGLISDEFRSANSCNWFMESAKLDKWSSVGQKKLITIWSKIFIDNPLLILGIHANRSEYLVPNPISLPSKPPFLHSNIEYANNFVKPWIPSIYEFARIPTRIWNAFGSFTAYAGLWWAFIILVSRRNSKLVGAALTSTILNASIFVTAIIPDARYVAFTLIAGFLSLSYAFYLLWNNRINLLDTFFGNRCSVK